VPDVAEFPRRAGLEIDRDDVGPDQWGTQQM
jgi:hypothetical protein